ncbi:ATP-binding cassette subfamily B protein [Evansella vedderi]|uniref:ATP-binding cassette subfamily B protein n=1 Tax=Evansella vedderi TaxID=38282 RepID=A0ABT9ZQC8_9BACI|nr:ABC transporter ATP-binding protein [Evansella vedderi]MDQ0253442.1 ATP-binding cassette subfamily B protein [Evansella vedderi]
MNIHKEKQVANGLDRELLSKLLAFAKPYWKKIVVAFVLAGLFVAATLVQPYLIKVAIDDYLTVESSLQESFQGFVIVGVLFLISVIGAAVLTYYQDRLLQFTGQSVIFDIREKLFRHLSKMHMQFFDRNPVGRLVTRVTHDTEALNQLYSQVIVNLVKEVLILVGIFIILINMSVTLTLISFTVIPFLIILVYFYKSLVRRAHRYTRLVLSRLNSNLAENLSGMRIIQFFTRERRQIRQFDHLNNEHYRAGMRGTVVNSIFNPAIGFLGNIALALIIWYGGIAVIDSALTFGVVYAFTHYIRQFFQPIMALADRYNQIQTAMASAERIFELMEEEPVIKDHPKARNFPRAVQGDIQFKSVSFAYVEGETVLKNISFHIRPGETVAFVGATGAGKSSIINLINRFYDIQAGAIEIDGMDIKKVKIADLRTKVGIIQQDPFIFTGDVIYNIRLHNDHLSDEDVKELTRSIGLEEFVLSLPNGYNTRLGEQGVILSSGQRQLISFLRALAFDPDILILDEATSNIDTETEELVQKALYRISEGRTTIIVAHRLSTIKHADNIIVMDRGEIRETGDHYDLLKQRGIYHRLYQIQNKESIMEKRMSGIGKGMKV